MAKKAVITDVSTGYQSNTTLNNNFEALNDAFDNTLSRDGSTPNEMNSDLDMNGNAIINVGSISNGSGGATWTSGTGSPEGVVTATAGSLYTDTNGGASTTLYVKESGSGNTGWVAK